MIAVGFLYATALKKVAAQFPKTTFAIIDSSVEGATNVTGLTFAENEGSFLVGAAAALKTKTGNVGYIGGCHIPLLQKFEAGFTAGAKAVNPDIKVQVKYLSNPPTCNGFNDTAEGTEAAQRHVRRRRRRHLRGGRRLRHRRLPGGQGQEQAGHRRRQRPVPVGLPRLQPVIMTSMLKRVDVAVYDFIKSAQSAAPLTGVQVFDLKKDGVGTRRRAAGGRHQVQARRLQAADHQRQDQGPDNAGQSD